MSEQSSDSLFRARHWLGGRGQEAVLTVGTCEQEEHHDTHENEGPNWPCVLGRRYYCLHKIAPIESEVIEEYILSWVSSESSRQCRLANSISEAACFVRSLPLPHRRPGRFCVPDASRRRINHLALAAAWERWEGISGLWQSLTRSLEIRHM